MSELEYHRQMCSLVTLIAKHEVLLRCTRYARDDKRDQLRQAQSTSRTPNPHTINEI